MECTNGGTHGNGNTRVAYGSSDARVAYGDGGTVRVSGPHGCILHATATVSQDREQEKKTATVTIQFDEPVGNASMVAYLWDTEAGTARIGIIDALDVLLGRSSVPELYETDQLV